MTTDKVELDADIGLTGGDKLGSGAKAEAEVRANRLGPSVDGTAVSIVLTVKITLGNEQASDALIDIDVMAGNEEIGGDETSSKVYNYYRINNFKNVILLQQCMTTWLTHQLWLNVRM